MFGLLPLCLAICICVSGYGYQEMNIVCNIISEVHVTLTNDWTPQVVLKVVSEEDVFEKYKPFGIVISLDNDPIYTGGFEPEKKPYDITLQINNTLEKKQRSSLRINLECIGNCASCSGLYEENVSTLLVPTFTNQVTVATKKHTSSYPTYMFVFVSVVMVCLIMVLTCFLIKRRRSRNDQSNINSSSRLLPYTHVQSPSLPNDSLVVFMDDNLEDDIFLQITDHMKRHFELILPRDHELKISENRHDWIDQNILSKHCRNFLKIIKGVEAADDRVLSPAERAVMKDVQNLNQNNILTLCILYKPDGSPIPSGNTVMSCHRSMVDEEMTRVVSFFRDP